MNSKERERNYERLKAHQDFIIKERKRRKEQQKEEKMYHFLSLKRRRQEGGITDIGKLSRINVLCCNCS